MKSIIFKLGLCFLFISGYVQGTTLDEYYQGNLKITDYNLIAEKRISNTIFEYTYKITVENTSGVRLRGVSALFTSILVKIPEQEIDFNSSVKGLQKSTDPLLIFGDFDVNETKQNIDTFTIRYDRSIAPLNLSNLFFVFHYSKEILFNDTQNNHFSLFIPSYVPPNLIITSFVGIIQYNLSDLLITPHKNPTNINSINNLPFITDQFIEMQVPQDLLNLSIYIEVKYNTEPYRILLLDENKIKWAVFEKDISKKIAKFILPIDENGKVTFALIGVYQ